MDPHHIHESRQLTMSILKHGRRLPFAERSQMQPRRLLRISATVAKAPPGPHKRHMHMRVASAQVPFTRAIRIRGASTSGRIKLASCGCHLLTAAQPDASGCHRGSRKRRAVQRVRQIFRALRVATCSRCYTRCTWLHIRYIRQTEVA